MLPKEINQSSPSTFNVLGLQVHLLEDYLAWLVNRLRHGLGTHVVTLNAEMSMIAQQNPILNQTIKKAELVIPDGAGVILYMRLRGLKHQRCPGIELAESLISYLGQSESPSSLCFFGGASGIAETAASNWQKKFPSLSILTQDGFLSETTEITWKQTLKERQPEVILVGIGVPRQELWIRENRDLCPHSLWIGVGGSLDIWSGNKVRAPQWLCDNNLEWSYRLYQEPWRWRRMLALPQFFWRSLWSK